jgi:hypothetical protein
MARAALGTIGMDGAVSPIRRVAPSGGTKIIPLTTTQPGTAPIIAPTVVAPITPIANSQATAVVAGPKAIPLAQPLQVGTPAAMGAPTPPNTGVMFSATTLPIAPAAPLSAIVATPAPQIITTQPIVDPTKQIPLATTPRVVSLVANSGNDISQASSAEIGLPPARFTLLDGLVIAGVLALAVFVFERS